MRTALLLVVLIFWIQNADAKEIKFLRADDMLQNQISLFKSTELANLDVNRLLSINDLWNKIKNSISNAWNAIKDIASKTKEKIDEWIQDLKKRAEKIVKEFECRLEILKDKLNKLIQDIRETAGDVKLCIQEDKKAIQELLKHIAIRVTSCIADSIKETSVLQASFRSRTALDDQEFLKRAESKMNKCVQNLEVEDSENCLNKARGEIFDDMEYTENAIMETRASTRNLADAALETILQCAADGIIDASGAITEEVLKIINCVIEEKEKGLYL